MTVEKIIEIIKKDYLSCPNMMEVNKRIYCHTWYRHDDCVRLMNLLYKITNDSKYTLPEIKQDVKDAINEMLTDPSIFEILKRLKD
jgi:hypothetical protein